MPVYNQKYSSLFWLYLFDQHIFCKIIDGEVFDKTPYKILFGIFHEFNLHFYIFCKSINDPDDFLIDLWEW